MNIDISVIYTIIGDVGALANEASFSKHRCRELSRQCKYIQNVLKRNNVDELPALDSLYDVLKECKEYVIKMSTSNPIQKIFKGYNGKMMYEKLSDELQKWFNQLQDDISSYPPSIINDDKEDNEKMDDMNRHMHRASKIATADAKHLKTHFKHIELKGKIVQIGKKIDTYALGNVYEGLYDYKYKAIIREIEFLEDYIKKAILLNMSLHDCNNILKIYGICDNMIVYESSMFSLQELLCYEIKDKLSLCRKIATGINYIHECNIIHKDICPKNIMIGYDFNPKITGFEMSRQTDEHTRSFNTDHIDIKYWSPERKEGKGSSKESDVYAFGMIMCDIMQTIPTSLEDCLNESNHRPSMSEVLLELIKLETLC